MKRILEQWNGEFDIDGKVKSNLVDWKPKNGETFRIKLLKERKCDVKERKCDEK